VENEQKIGKFVVTFGNQSISIAIMEPLKVIIFLKNVSSRLLYIIKPHWLELKGLRLLLLMTSLLKRSTLLHKKTIEDICLLTYRNPSKTKCIHKEPVKESKSSKTLLCIQNFMRSHFLAILARKK